MSNKYVYGLGQGETGMHIATRIKRYLAAKGVPYALYQLNCGVSLSQAVSQIGIDPSQVAVPILISRRQGQWMVVTSVDRVLSCGQLSHVLHEPIRLVPHHDVDKLFSDCAPGIKPALAVPYQLPCMLDKSLMRKDKVYFVSGCPSILVGVDSDEYLFLHPHAQLFEWPEFEQLPTSTDNSELIIFPGTATASEHDQLDHIMPLAAVPETSATANALLKHQELREDEVALLSFLDEHGLISRQLCKVGSAISHKPCSCSHEVIEHLGGCKTYDLALACAIILSFRVPLRGPLGLNSVWQHALYSSILAESLLIHVPKHHQQKLTNLHLTCLLQHVGVLLLGHIFRPEFIMLNKWVTCQPHICLSDFEQRLVGLGQAHEILRFGYAQLGGWLLKRWRLNQPVIQGVSHQLLSHSETPLVHMLQVVNYMLTCHRVSYATLSDYPEHAFACLGLSLDLVDQHFTQVAKDYPRTDQLAFTQAA
ncbi:HDOD domain-containing protein [Zooshikella marina]|uniref:HDOD domain-containing protein n=1 Tax=Zooshikella ganghwensis TaxID=202772 RepID=UPI001BB07D0C|nr:HDOD domain-containing protein [Zooshikella ganghwensis]MBU2705748.1 HDOD domain-containing protein [Zooshikella ganghwensis]